MSARLTFGSLFAGIGGFDLGFERAGFECRWQVEIDDYCRAVLAKHWPDVERFTDVRECGKHNLKTVDVIVGGFPCQPHSVAGKRKGAEDDRNLWPEFIRIIREMGPRYVVAENVPGIIATYLDQVLSDLEGEGYTCWTFNIPAVAVDAPHRRERIFVVAHAESDLRGTSGHDRPKPSNGSRSFVADAGREGIYKRWQPGDAKEKSAQPGGMGSDGLQKGKRQQGTIMAHTSRKGLEEWQGQPGNDGKEQSPTIRTSWWATEPDVGRVADGVPFRVDRLRALGNAVVPDVAEWIAWILRRILEASR